MMRQKLVAVVRRLQVEDLVEVAERHLQEVGLVEAAEQNLRLEGP